MSFLRTILIVSWLVQLSCPPIGAGERAESGQEPYLGAKLIWEPFTSQPQIAETDSCWPGSSNPPVSPSRKGAVA